MLKKIKDNWLEIISLACLLIAILIDGSSWTLLWPSLMVITVSRSLRMISDMTHKYINRLLDLSQFASEERSHLLDRVIDLEKEIKKLKDK